MNDVNVHVTWHIDPWRGTFFGEKDTQLLEIVESQFKHKDYYLKRVENLGRQLGVYKRPKWWWKFVRSNPSEEKLIGYLLILT